MQILRQILRIVTLEARFFVQFPKLVAAALLVMLIPALYVVIYLSSVWDPVSHSGDLPVALVNLDRDVVYRDQTFNVGREISDGLRARKPFGFVDFTSEDEARKEVREGRMAFALIFPADFSSHAIPGQSAGAGKLVVFTSEGNNYQSAQIARNFASELGHDVNENLNARRWQLVLNQTAGSRRSVEQLRQGVEQLRTGAHELSRGSGQLATGARDSAGGVSKLSGHVEQLSDGMQELGNGLRTMDSKRPRNSDLRRLRNGAESLAEGQRELGKGLAELQTGGQRIEKGVEQFRDEARDSLLVPARVGDGLEELLSGTRQLNTGLQAASSGQQQLTEGTDTLVKGVDTLANGVLAMNNGIRTMVGKLPEDRQLEELEAGTRSLVTATAGLADGARKVKAGSERLEGGLDLLASSLPPSVDQPGGSAQGLANSVTPRIEVEARVPNSGSAFGPNVISAALWLGAGVAAFLFHVRVLSQQARQFHPVTQVLGKLIVPMAIGWLQCPLVLLIVVYVLHIGVAMPGIFILTLLLSATTFLFIVFALTRAFGDAGKALAMIFLAIQLSSSGGVLPVELSGDLYAGISPWLPLTWVVRALKTSMFGAYDAQWQLPLTYLAVCCASAFACACLIGRWRFVDIEQMRPAVDF